MLEDFSTLLKEIRETTELILKLPEKLVDLIVTPQLNYHSWKKRIKILKELVEHTENKGSVFIKRLDEERRALDHS
jgi:hypothetical protein